MTALQRPTPLDPVAALQTELEEAKAQVAEWREKAYRGAADLDNARKRFQKERTELRTYGVEPLIQELLPVADNLERAIAHASAENNLAEGVKMVLRQFMQVLATKGAVPFDAKGEMFDPAVHEAMSQIPSADQPPGTVLEVFQRAGCSKSDSSDLQWSWLLLSPRQSRMMNQLKSWATLASKSQRKSS